MEDVKKQNDEILGYGKKLKILAGSKEDGGENIIEYHFTPVPLKDIPTLTALLDKFFENSEKEVWNKESIGIACDIIRMSIKRMHPDIDSDTIGEQFTLAGIAKAVGIVMDVNDFLSEMETITNQSKGVNNLAQVSSQKKNKV